MFGILKVTLQHLYPADKAQNNSISRDAPWKTFTHKTYPYSVSYPTRLQATETAYTIIFHEEQGQFARPGFPPLYITAIPDGLSDTKEVYNFMSRNVIDSLYSAKINEAVQTESGDDAQYWTFTKLAAFPVSGEEGIIIQNNNVQHGEGIVNRRILVKKDGVTYVIGSYYKTQAELDEFFKFLQSFKFLR